MVEGIGNKVGQSLGFQASHASFGMMQFDRSNQRIACIFTINKGTVECRSHIVQRKIVALYFHIFYAGTFERKMQREMSATRHTAFNHGIRLGRTSIDINRIIIVGFDGFDLLHIVLSQTDMAVGQLLTQSNPDIFHLHL